MLIGDIVYFRPESFVGKVVSVVTRCEYSHVGMYVGDNQIVESNIGIKTRIIDFTYNKDIHAVYRVRKMSVEQRLDIQRYAKSLCGYPYDYIQILGMFFQIIFNWNQNNLLNRTNYLICSELIDKAYYFAEVPRRGDKVLGDILPMELTEIYSFRKVM